MGKRMLKTKMRAFSFVVHLIGELGEHKTLPTLQKEQQQQRLHSPLLYIMRRQRRYKIKHRFFSRSLFNCCELGIVEEGFHEVKLR